MIVLYIFSLVFVILLIMPIRINLNASFGNKNHFQLTICFIKFFNLNLNVNKIFSKIFQDDVNIITIRKALTFFKTFVLSKKINRTLLKMISVQRITFIGSFSNIYSYVLGNSVVSFIVELLKIYLKEVNNEYYSIEYSDNENIIFDFSFSIRLCYLLFTFIANIKDVYKVRKYLKTRKVNYESFNK